MRIRTVKPEFWKHPVLARLDNGVRLLAIGLLTAADDEGFFFADPLLLRNDLFPFQNDSGMIPEWLQILSEVSYIELCDSVEMGPIGRVVNFTKHQKISHPTLSKIKAYWTPESLRSRSGAVPESFRPDQGSGKGTGNREVRRPVGAGDIKRADEATAVYAAYPRKVGRPAAIKAIIRALDKMPFKELLKAVEAYAAEQVGKDPQYIPHPTTWFNQERWADKPTVKPDEREIGFPVVKVSREKALWAEGEPDVIDLDSEYRKCVGEDSDETGVGVDSDVGSSGGNVPGDATEDVCDEEPADAVPS